MVGDKLDLDHPVIRSFLQERGRSTPAPARAPTKTRKVVVPDPTEPTGNRVLDIAGALAATGRRPELTDAERVTHLAEAIAAFSPGSPEDVEYLGKLLEPLIARFGTDEGCKNYLIALREKENIRAKRLDNEETEGQAIPREFVVTHIMSFLEELSKRLLGDLPKTLVRRLFSLANTGASHLEGEREAREAVSAHLELANKKISKTIRDDARRAAERRARADRGAGALAGGADRVADNPA